MASDFYQLNTCISLKGLNLKLFWRLANVKELCRDRRSFLLCPSVGSNQCGTRQQRAEVIWDRFYPSSALFQDWQTTLQSETILLLKELWQLENPNCYTLFSTTSAGAHPSSTITWVTVDQSSKKMKNGKVERKEDLDIQWNSFHALQGFWLTNPHILLLVHFYTLFCLIFWWSLVLYIWQETYMPKQLPWLPITGEQHKYSHTHIKRT